MSRAMPATSGRRGLLAAACGLSLILLAAPGIEPAAAKKGGRKAAVVKATNVPIADSPAPNFDAQTSVALRVGKKFKGELAGKVEITTQVTGNAPDYLDEINLRLSSPQGRTIFLREPNFDDLPNQSYGPMKETPNSPFITCGESPCSLPFELAPPFAGTVGNDQLTLLEGVRIRGTWTLQIDDRVPAGTGVLTGVTLRIKPAKQTE